MTRGRRLCGAEEVPEGGLWISGPCLGRNLRPLTIHVEKGAIILSEAAS